MEELTVDTLIAKIQDKDDNIRSAAWQGAGPVGAAAVKPLCGAMCQGELEVSRAANRALWKIVRHAGRPGADAERKAVSAPLVALLDDQQPPAARREVLWMLSEIGGDETVTPIAAVLANKELREDARCALQRIPGEKSLSALKAALDAAEEEFKSAVAESLRVRGVEVPGVPSKKLVPTKQTSVTPVGR